MRTWVGECYYKLNNFIQWKNFLKTTGKYKQFGRNEAISWMYFPQRFSCFSQLAQQYACHWRDKASPTWNKQAKVAKELVTASWNRFHFNGKQTWKAVSFGAICKFSQISLSLILKTFQGWSSLRNEMHPLLMWDTVWGDFNMHRNTF